MSCCISCGTALSLPKYPFRCLIQKKQQLANVLQIPAVLYFNGHPLLLVHLIGTLFKHVEELCLGREGRGSSVAAFPDTNKQSGRWSRKKDRASLLKGDLWDWLTSDHMSRSAEWGVYGADTIGGKINGAFMSVYWLGGCSHKASFIKTIPSVCISLPGFLTHSHTDLLFLYLLAIKSRFCNIPAAVRHISTDQPLTGITSVLLKRRRSYYQQLFIPFLFHLLIFLLFPLSSSSLLHFSCSTLACHSLPIWVTHTHWWQLLIPHSAERKVEPPKAQHAGSCVSFSMCS